MKKDIQIHKNKWVYIAAFMLPWLLFLIHLITRDSWLFGNGSILRGDTGVQYVYIFDELWNKVHNGDLSFYSWNAVCGYDFLLNMMYYTISPFTIILLLLPKELLYDGIQFFIILRWALLSLSAVYFFMNTKFNILKKNRQLVAFTLGICYALGNFFIRIINFFNWIDTLILFPILLLLVEDMLENGKWKLYYVLLTVAMLCNFYMAFPVCIFLLFWFLMNFWTVEHDCRVKRIVTFLSSSFLAGLSSMIVIVPSVLNVESRYTVGNEEKVYAYVRSMIKTLWDFFKKFFMFDFVDENNVITPMYMSVGVLLLCMLFFFIKTQKKVKYTKIAVLVFTFCSFFVGALNYVWHGFSVPHGIDHRYAFGFILLLCTMALDVLGHLKQITLQQCFIVIGISLLVFFYTFFMVEQYAAIYVYIATIFLLVIYSILLVLNRRKSLKKDIFVRVFCGLCILEICINAYYQLQVFEVSKPEEIGYVAEAAEIVQDVELKDGERIAFQDAGYGVGLKTNLPSISGFVSFFNGRLGDLNYNLGMNRVADAAIDYAGGTPIMNLLFNIRYGVGLYETQFSDCEVVNTGDNLILCEMEHLGGLGYMVSDSLLNWEGDDLSNFVNQNEFVEYVTDGKVDEVFEVFGPSNVYCASETEELEPQIEELEEYGISYHYLATKNTEGSIMEFVAEEDMDLYFTIKGSAEYYPSITVNDELVYQDALKMGRNIVHLKDVKKGDKISVICFVDGEIGNVVSFYLQFAKFNNTKYNTFYDMISDSTYQITSMEADNIKGEITVKEEGIMLTSVQDMKGFDVFVDGQQTNYKTIGGALIGIPLTLGTHSVEFQYHTQGFTAGCILSCVGILIFIVMCFANKRKRGDISDTI